MNQIFLKEIVELSQFLFAFSSKTVCLGSLPTEAKEGLSIPTYSFLSFKCVWALVPPWISSLCHL